MTSTFLWNISLWVQPTATLNRLLSSPYHQNTASQPQLHRNKSSSSRKIQAIKERQSPLQKSVHTPTPKLIRKVWPCSRIKCFSHFPNALSVWNHYTQTLIHILKNVLKDFHTTSALLAKYHVLACCKTLKECLCFHDLKNPNQATTISKNNVQKTSPLNGILQLKLKSRKANKASITSEYVIWSHLSERKTEPWVPMKFSIRAELHIRGCILLYRSNWNQWKLNKWELSQERSPWDTKGQGFSEVQRLGAKETGVTKTLKGFNVQSEELFENWVMTVLMGTLGAKCFCQSDRYSGVLW